MLRFEDKAASDGLVPQGQGAKEEQGGEDIERMSKDGPGTNAISFVQVHEFHKIHQLLDSTSKNESSSQEFRDERPVRIEITEYVADETGEDKQHGVAVNAGCESIDDVSQPAAGRDVGHLNRQIPDMTFDPRGNVSG